MVYFIEGVPRLRNVKIVCASLYLNYQEGFLQKDANDYSLCKKHERLGYENEKLEGDHL